MSSVAMGKVDDPVPALSLIKRQSSDTSASHRRLSTMRPPERSAFASSRLICQMLGCTLTMAVKMQ